MNHRAYRAGCAAVILLLAACSQPVQHTPIVQTPAPEPIDPIDPIVLAMASEIDTLADTTAGIAVAEFYADSGNRPAWFDDDDAPRPAIKTLLDTLSRADRQGLSVSDYGYDMLAGQIQSIDDARMSLAPAQLAALDVRLSLAFVAYAVDLHRGRIEPGQKIRPRWYEDLPPGDYAGALAHAATQGSVDDALAALRPPHAGYALLVKALADYRAIADSGGWPTIGDGPLLETGMRDTRVPTLRRRLHIAGDLPIGTPAGENIADGVSSLERMDHKRPVELRSNTYDSELAASVAHFQARHGLATDGRVGPATRGALNVSAAARAHQIELNLERWRWLPGDLGARYVMVNIPEYRLRAFEHDRPVLQMNVVVGDAYDDRATPVFSDRMKYVIFRPYWNIPYGIAVKEILPRARANIGYLAARQYQIVKVFGPNATPLAATQANLDRVEAGALHMRQAAGPHNALGLIKFMFPNEYAVYLHDSPAAQLFSRTERGLSHGCVRVADPAALAEFVLAGRPEWTRERIHKALHGGERQYVSLARELPVYLIYWTAFINDDGVQFRSDLYGHDPQLERAMRSTHAMAPQPEGG